MMKIEVGQIWEVITDYFWSSGDYNKKFENGRETATKTRLKKGEFIEIRFPYDWHFRTSDNIYLHATHEELIKHCRPYGIIDEEVRWLNKMSLKDILDKKLFKSIWRRK